MGYADVGADVYIALGLIALYAAGAAPLALALAGITYMATGLCYAELASTYPVAGGAQYYSMKAFGSLHGFIAGWGLMLDYTIDIALFALASTGYLGFFTQIIWGTDILLISPYYGLVAILMIIMLIALNILGVKYSSWLNIFFVTLSILTIGTIILLGLPLVISNGSFSRWLVNIQNLGVSPSWGNFLYGLSLAMVSYIGIESISQAAEETKHPAKVIPTATKATIVAVLVVAITLSLLSVTLIPASMTAGEAQKPALAVASHLPLVGPIFIIWVAFMGFTICMVSTNTGVIGVSRVTFSMGRLNLFPKVFGKLHPRLRTPYVTIITFSSAACLIILANIFLPGIELLGLVASLYNFGALIAYMYVNLALIILRTKDRTPRAWKIPGSITIRTRTRNYEIPILPLVGFISCAIVWLIIVGTHPLGRLLGTFWFIIGIVIYVYYRKKKGLPIQDSKGEA
jgi:APA family basic amino acid/polyamine antiporter